MQSASDSNRPVNRVTHCAAARNQPPRIGTARHPDGHIAEGYRILTRLDDCGGRLPTRRGRLYSDLAATHYAGFSYSFEILGDDKLWAQICDGVGGNYGHREGDMLIVQWQTCIDHDVMAELPNRRVPIDIVGFSEDCQAPPPIGRRIAKLASKVWF